MKRKNVVLLGIDGMDYDLTLKMIDKLPVLKKLSQDGTAGPLRSVFPPDSIPAWITCYTGLDPSEHGVLESVNYLAKGDDRLKVDTSAFQGKTFWDVIGGAGNSVCVINPFMAYPVWPVKGVMINGPVFIGGDIQVSDPSWTEGTNIPETLGGIVDFPNRKNMAEFVAKTFSDTREQADFGLKILKKNRPNLFFQTFLTMDRLQHFLWRYCDPQDPTYPGKNQLEDSIEKFYILIDAIIGEYLACLGPDDELIVLSDHGHGMRCTHCFNLNEELRSRGYVHSVAEGKLFSKQLLVEKLKNSVLNFMNEHNLEDYISVIAKFVPNAKKLKKGKHITKESDNIAYASDFTGTNPFGGVCINKSKIDDYQSFRDQLKDELAGIEINGEPIFLWIKKREDMFAGAYLDRFPDLLFCLRPQFGVNWCLHTKTVTTNPTHKKISGGHKEHGIFFSSIPRNSIADPNDLIMNNIFSTLLARFGIDGRPYSKGRSFIQKSV